MRPLSRSYTEKESLQHLTDGVDLDAVALRRRVRDLLDELGVRVHQDSFVVRALVRVANRRGFLWHPDIISTQFIGLQGQPLEYRSKAPIGEDLDAVARESPLPSPRTWHLRVVDLISRGRHVHPKRKPMLRLELLVELPPVDVVGMNSRQTKADALLQRVLQVLGSKVWYAQTELSRQIVSTLPFNASEGDGTK